MAGSRKSRGRVPGRREEEKKSLRPGRFSRSSKRRLLTVFFLVLAALILLIGRLIWLTIKDGQAYQRNVMSIMSGDGAVIPFRRGDILDSSRSLLATSERIYTLILDTRAVTDARNENQILRARNKIAEVVKDYFDISADELNKAFDENQGSYYVVLKKGISFEEKEKYDEFYEAYLESLDGKKGEEAENLIGNGIWFEEGYKRNYPYGSLACSVIGFLDAEGAGTRGLEKYYNDRLSGTDGRNYALIDEGTSSRNVTREPVNGCSIITTLDVNIQRIVEKYIQQFRLIRGAENIGVMVMDPNEGTVLAMGGSPGFDLNDPYDLSAAGYSDQELDQMSTQEQSAVLDSLWKNYCVNDSYEPGSTAKTMTVAYAMDQDAAAPDDSFQCDGYLTYEGGTTVTCNSVHGPLDLQESLMYSCNVAMMKIAERLGTPEFVKMQSMFGIGRKTGIDLDGELDCASLIFNEDNMGPIELWTSSFGQGFNCTMVQMAAAFCSIVNGGHYYQPHIVSEICNDSGNTLQLIDKTLMRETISEQTSSWMREALYQTVESGTAIPARVPGYKIGGKTGTAEVGKRGSDDRLVSFIGAAPIDDPQIVVYVVIDRPHAKDQGQSAFACTMAGKIFSETLQYLQIFPTEAVTDEEREAFEKLLAEDEDKAQRAANGEVIEDDSQDPDEEEAGGEEDDGSYQEDGEGDGSYQEEGYDEGADYQE